MSLPFKDALYFTLILLASLNSIKARRELFAGREIGDKNANQANYCSYDGRIYFKNKYIHFTQNDVWACHDSYAYSISSKYIVLKITDINIHCNGFNNIELWDNIGKKYIYCQDKNAPSSVTFYTDKARWIGFSRLGYVAFNLKIEFLNIYIPNTVVVTVPPITSVSFYTHTTSTLTSMATTGLTSQNCGVQQIRPDESGLNRIVGGQIVVPNSWPWQVGLKRHGSFFCGASLINDQWLLTAAHCESSVNGLVAHLGDHNIRNDYSGETQFSALKWISHPEYNDREILNDIALIKLSKKVRLSRTIQPVCLPNQKQPIINTTGIVTGWGIIRSDGSGRISDELRQVAIPINPESVCGYGDLPDSQICAGVRDYNNPKDSCQGDSGGPFVIKDPKTGAYYVAGVVSYGVSCGGRGAYTKVASYESWIKNTIDQN